ncbi:MAG TPA: hypothetical protein VEZ55_14755 [Chitinophagaceae bacterium]|nr:hypothetical protein [Chitinophagaceae bacterium]
MKSLLTAICAILISVTLCNAQSSDKPGLNAVSFELGKTGLIYNLNFDHKLASKNFGFRVGAGSNLGMYLTVISVGGGGYHLIGNKNRFFELGLDIQYLIVDEVSDDQKGFASIFVYPNYSTKTLYPSANLGYRKYGNKTVFRGGLAPGFINNKVVPGGYLSFGVTF